MDVRGESPSGLEQARLERYKFILAEMGRLNENSHRHTKYFLAIFPALSSIALALKANPGAIVFGKEIAPIVSLGLMQVITMASIFGLVSVASDIASWIDYRREEVRLITSMGGTFRSDPKISKFWKWYETYLIVFLIMFPVFLWRFYLLRF